VSLGRSGGCTGPGAHVRHALQTAAALALLLPLVLATPALAQRRSPPEHQDVWSDPNPGIRYLRRTTTTPCSIHALVVSLAVEGVRIETTPYEQRWRAVSEFARGNHMAAAVNGGFWGTFARAQGVTAGGGRRWPHGTNDEEYGYFAVRSNGRAYISPPEDTADEIPQSRITQAVSGRPMLVRSGAVEEEGLSLLDWARRRHPRTAVGVSADGRTVILVVSDGRQTHSRGMTLFEVAELMVELGADAAINLDGGGSSAMYLDRAGGVVSAPSGGRWEARLGFGVIEEEAAPAKVRLAVDGVQESYVRGIEREVMNHIGVVAPLPNEEAGLGRDELGGVPMPDAAVVVARPRPPPIALGRAREMLYPLMAGVAIAGPLLLIALILWRRRRRRLRATRT